MPSEIVEQIREQVAYYERTHPLPDPAERREREFEQRKREAQKAHEARKTREAEAASTNWYTAVDGRIHEHLKSWLWTAIDQRVVQLLEQHFFSGKRGVGGAVIGGLTDAVLKLVGKLKRTIEEQQRAFEAKFVALEQRAASNNDRIETAIAHERDVLIETRAEFKNAIEELCSASGAELAALEQRLKAVPGKLPVVKNWCPETVTYQAEFVVHDGSLWQAKTDTAQAPGGSDWVCVARAGCDGQSIRVRGAFAVHKKYTRFDVIEHDGSSFVAIRDNPGNPWDGGWQLVSRSGRRGPTGERGLQGRKGERGPSGADAPTIVSWTLDRKNYRAIPTMSNGAQGAVLELRGLFEQLVEETSRAAE